MGTYLILSEKKWNQNLAQSFDNENDYWVLINKKEDFTLEKLTEIGPEKIFIPHWSHYIPEEIYTKFECVVFHETNLPFGRGGSPIQNLIDRGIKNTKITALRADEKLDAGPIYLKKDLSLLGTAEEIFLRANTIVKEMISEIVEKDIEPVPQSGKPTFFKRRNPSQSNIEKLTDLEKVFDYIRMLDAEGYPKAFIETEHFKFEFSRASLKSNETIIADVRIIKK